MNTTHVTSNTTVALGELADREYLTYALRGISLGTGTTVRVEYSPDSGVSWYPIEGHGTDATPPLVLGSCRGPLHWPEAPLRLNVSGGTSIDFTIDFAVGQL